MGILHQNHQNQTQAQAGLPQPQVGQPAPVVPTINTGGAAALSNSSGKRLVLAQWLPLIYEGEPTPLPALPLEVSFYPSKGGMIAGI